MTTKITKAVIAAAGRGTRFLPVVKQYPKELIAILDKPQIQYLIEELLGAGINQICIVHRHGDPSIKRYFTPDSDLENYLIKNNKLQYLDSLKNIWSQVKFKFIPQPTHLPYGNASPVLAAKSFIGTDPFIYLFGDDLTIEKNAGYYLRKMITTYQKYSPAAVVAVKDVGPVEIVRYGSAKYIDNSPYPHQISGMYEKLPADKAPSFFGQGGRFILNGAKLFPIINQKVTGKDNELWLADAINILAQNDIVLTEAFDEKCDWLTTGDPLRWLKANITVALNDKNVAPELKVFLHNLK
ncbi:NTP transferase domain-containing protein [Candidatus Shapirobacteria bacterium]|nr:NTP transferase domain-containing protein [Candidatus Shapirobacteria bacterium]